MLCFCLRDRKINFVTKYTGHLLFQKLLLINLKTGKLIDKRANFLFTLCKELKSLTPSFMSVLVYSESERIVLF